MRHATNPPNVSKTNSKLARTGNTGSGRKLIVCNHLASSMASTTVACSFAHSSSVIGWSLMMYLPSNVLELLAVAPVLGISVLEPEDARRDVGKDVFTNGLALGVQIEVDYNNRLRSGCSLG
jgi:hypothetical protein